MQYRIADVTIHTEIALPSFERFACEEGGTGADLSMVLAPPEETVPDGPEVISEYIAQRKLDDGWFFHSVHDDRMGLLVDSEYTRLRLVGHEAYQKRLQERRIRVKSSAGDRSGEGDRAGAAEAGRRADDPGADNTPLASRPATSLQEALIRMAIECQLARKGFVSLHSACVELDGEAYAFSGPSGTGKSTRANAWMDAFEEADLISGDRPLISVKDLEVYGVPWDGKENCLRNVHYPLKVIFEVRRKETAEEHADEDNGAERAYIRRMTYEQKRKLLLRQCFIPMWDTETAVIQMMNIAKLASSAPILRAFCGRYTEDAMALKTAFESGQYKKEETDMKAKDGFVLRDIVGEKILMPTGSNIGKFKGTVLLNDVSAFVWNKLQTPMSREDLLAAILDEFEVEESVAAADLDALLATFTEYGVIEKD